MTRNSIRFLSTGLAAVALMGATQLPQIARAAPTAPVADSTATDATLSSLAMSASSGATVTVGGVQMRILATLPVTQKAFTMAAITWSSSTGSPTLQMRARGAAGWTEWKTLEAEPDGVSEEERHGQRLGTDPTWFDESTAVEARVLTTSVANATIADPRVTIVDTRVASTDSGLQTAARANAGKTVTSAAGVTYATTPAIISRAQWGADERLLSYNGSSCVKATIDTTIKAAIVHNTAGSNNYSATQSAAIVRGIYAYHVKDRGWCDIGYNFLVDKYGQAFEGRHGGIQNVVHGAHATSWNTDTVGVSVMMDSNTAVQTPESMQAMTRIIAWKLAGNYRDPLSTLTLAGKRINRIARHGDVMSTDCPGTNVTAYMPTLRQQVATAMGDWKTPIYTAWQAEGGESGHLGSPHVLERTWNGGRTTSFTGGGIYQTPAGQTFWMDAAPSARYLASDGFTVLGWPLGNQTSPATGVTQVRFEKGTLTTSSTTGVRMTTGVVDAWLRAHPTEASRLGLPTADATSTSTGGSQTFQRGRLDWTGTTVTASYGSGKQGDLDGDGRADVLTVASNGTVSWYPTTVKAASGTAAAGDALQGSPFTWISQVPDINADGNAELVARRSDGTLWSWWGAGQGRYTGMHQVGYGWNGMREINIVPDMNGDGLPEIVAISPAQNLVRYQLGKQMTVVNTQQIGQRWSGIVNMTSVGDFRRAGVTDVLGVTADGKLWDFKGTGVGTVSDGVQVGWGWQGFTQVRSIGDLDGDGQWDLVGNRSTGALYGYRSLKGSFGDRTPLLPEVGGLGLLA